MAAISNHPYSILVESEPEEEGSELVQLHPFFFPNRAEEFPPDVMNLILKMSGINYSFLNKRWHQEYIDTQCIVVGRKVAQLYPIRALFPEITGRRRLLSQGLGELNTKIEQLYALYSDSWQWKDVEKVFEGANKVVCYKRFKDHSERLARLILEQKRWHTPDFRLCELSSFAIGCFTCSLIVGFTSGKSSYPLVIGGAVIGALFTMALLKQTYRSRVYKTPSQRIEAYLGRPLRDIKAQLRPSLIAVPEIAIPLDIPLD